MKPHRMFDNLSTHSAHARRIHCKDMGSLVFYVSIPVEHFAAVEYV